MVSTIHLAHMPPDLLLYVALYVDVSNAAFLKDQLLAGNAEFEYAFIDASMILSTKHVLAASFRAMNDYLNDRLKSRNIHSEIVFSLSPSNNIAEAFRRFGITETTKNLLVLKVATTPDVTHESVSSHLSTRIQGTECVFEDATIRKVSDLERIRKAYKLGSATNSADKQANIVDGTMRGGSGKDVDDEQTRIRNLEVQILGLMALRGAT
ncbi:uncharacterized protein Z518_02698 [Rhinocladiella mackenziei CBS 650.93]|uniref:EKC/KEOPS complex subunit CGI121 n=1 Tax=Rhinocladiella mackenziei CBS 650.93 TaxID=1442369 RepID=A0A0D2HC89_9EURO|nr:uncharacterized protein Z518_02698 [Rhinocladiella mackenziei CBS 650.93]KIX08043.1 hypothetical protein Z518_02698 [Rhinocladiella mackenziei CBS 650.93]